VWGTRLAEWGLMVVLLLVLVAVFAHQVRELRGQAELAQIKSTLGALRTALVVAHLEASVASTRPRGGTVVQAQRNPFAALQQSPPNYAGLANPEALATLPGGSWVFDTECHCIGYRPTEAGWLQSPAGASALWFRVASSAGPLQITPLQTYVWMGQPVD
jgi:hypothetical protein